jgi:hypothetical protein
VAPRDSPRADPGPDATIARTADVIGAATTSPSRSPRRFTQRRHGDAAMGLGAASGEWFPGSESESGLRLAGIRCRWRYRFRHRWNEACVGIPIAARVSPHRRGVFPAEAQRRRGVVRVWTMAYRRWWPGRLFRIHASAGAVFPAFTWCFRTPTFASIRGAGFFRRPLASE